MSVDIFDGLMTPNLGFDFGETGAALCLLVALDFSWVTGLSFALLGSEF